MLANQNVSLGAFKIDRKTNTATKYNVTTFDSFLSSVGDTNRWIRIQTNPNLFLFTKHDFFLKKYYILVDFLDFNDLPESESS